jgi:hypothetical protein
MPFLGSWVQKNKDFFKKLEINKTQILQTILKAEVSAVQTFS